VGVRRALQRALASSPSGEVIEGLARAAYLELDFYRAIEGWERAYAAYRTVGDQLGAIRVARTLAGTYFAILGDRAVSNGWLARAQTLLAGAADSAEAGWVALNLGMFEGDRVRKEEHFRAALQAARRAGDTDLELMALAYLGASLVHGDRIEEGMLLLDEALAAVPVARSTTSRSWRRSSASCSRPVSTHRTSPGPSSGFGSGRRSPGGASSPPSPLSAAHTTAAC
jgi:tetratricopeptide (TPR) repeat protein